MITYILIGIVAIVVLFVVIAAMQPADFCVKRTGTVSAPAPVVFAQVNDLHKWKAWSPWAKMDPNAKETFEGTPAGTGASFSWAGNNQVGEGRMTITDSRPDELIRIKLEFKKPFVATNDAEFNFTSDRGQTTVTWSMSGTRNFMFKAMGLFMNCDKMVGGQFEKGLADMKLVAEATNKASPEHVA